MIFSKKFRYFSITLQALLTNTNAIPQSLSSVQASNALIKFKTSKVCFHIIMPH